MRFKGSKGFTGAARVMAIIFVVMMVLGLLSPVLSSFVLAVEAEATAEEQDEIENLGDKYAQLQAKQKEYQNEISKAVSEKQKQVVISQQIGAQIETTTQQIDILTERIDLLGEKIVEKKLEQEEKQKEYDETYGKFKQRLGALSRAASVTTVGMVLGSDSYSQLVNRSEIMDRVATYDRILMDDLEKQKKELAEIQKQIEADKKSVEDDKVEMNSKRQELSSQKAETQKQIEDISRLEQKFRENEAEMKRQMAQVQAEIDKIYKEIAARSTMAEYVGGEMAHPAPGLYQITSNFGLRFNGSDNHTGVDFAGTSAYGKPVVAANDGEVAKVVTADIPGYGYGKYVIIDHGGGITTLYAHNSSIMVSEGQMVTRGQQIAAIGSTGWATGPHCHFEVRINGSAVNPLPYVQGK